MVIQEIVKNRLYNQLLTSTCDEAAEVVTWMGAVQAQDYAAAKWTIGIRTSAACEPDIDKAVAEGSIVRTWPMRGTLHFVSASDIRWMLTLLTPRIVANNARRYKQLELDDTVFTKTRKLLIRALKDRKMMTRQFLYSVFESENIASGNQRGIHILQKHAMEGLICFGPHDGKQPTFVLLDEWIPGTRDLNRDEALAVLAKRYFSSHGPALLKDFVWWAGMTASAAKEAIELVKPELSYFKINEQYYWFNPEFSPSLDMPIMAFLLPGFDEYILGYTDRSTIVDKKYFNNLTPGGGMFNSTIVLSGKVVGTWKRTIKKGLLQLEIIPFGKLTNDQKEAIRKAEKRYTDFLENGK
jgi:hypothetical protein